MQVNRAFRVVKGALDNLSSFTGGKRNKIKSDLYSGTLEEMPAAKSPATERTRKQPGTQQTGIYTLCKVTGYNIHIQISIVFVY